MKITRLRCRVLAENWPLRSILILVVSFFFCFTSRAEQLFEQAICPTPNITTGSKFFLSNRAEIYTSMRFYFSTDEERKLASSSAGTVYLTCEKNNTCGLKLPISIAVFSNKGRKLIEMSFNAGGRDGYTDNYFDRPMSNFYLESGYYDFKIQLRDNYKCDANQKISISVSTEGRPRIGGR